MTEQTENVFSAGKLDEAKRTALEQCIQGASLPIIGEFNDAGQVTPIYPRGTGLLFGVESRLFLVTAAHVLDDIEFSTLSFPRRAGDQVQTFGNAKIFRPHPSDNIDVAVIELEDASTIELLRSNWTVLTFENVVPKGQYRGGDRLICGYPGAKAQNSEFGIHQRPLVLSTVELDHTPSVSNSSPEVDAFYLLDENGYNMATGKKEVIPNLRGVSGGGIWLCTDIPSSNFWKPLDILKLNATQVSVSSGTWIRGAYWDAAAKIFMSAEVGLTNSQNAMGI